MPSGRAFRTVVPMGISEPASRRQPPDRDRHLVLLIDDSRTMREVLKVYLMGGKYEFVEAESAARALDLLRTEPVEVVIADVNMPKMDGIQLLHALRRHEDPHVRGIPVILITGDKSEDVHARLKDAHADAFLQKPLRAESLVALVEQLLAAHR